MKKTLAWIVLVATISCSPSDEVKRQQLFLKGNIALEENDYETALYYYNQSLEISDTFAAALNNRAIVYERRKEYEKAFADYEKAISVNPGFSPAYFNRANLWSQRGNYRNALNDLEAIQDQYSDSASFYFSRGLVYSGLKEYEKAAQDFEKSVDIDPSNPENHINLAMSNFYLKENKKAGDQLENAFAIDPGNADALNLQALLLSRAGDYDKALESLNKALKRASNPYFYNNRGYVYLMKGELEKGLEDINYSLVMGENNAWAHRNKGIYFFLKDEFAKAEEQFLKSLTLDPHVELTHYYLGMVNLELGNSIQACEFFKTSAELGEKEGAEKLSDHCGTAVGA